MNSLSFFIQVCLKL